MGRRVESQAGPSRADSQQRCRPSHSVRTGRPSLRQPPPHAGPAGQRRPSLRLSACARLSVCERYLAGMDGFPFAAYCINRPRNEQTARPKGRERAFRQQRLSSRAFQRPAERDERNKQRGSSGHKGARKKGETRKKHAQSCELAAGGGWSSSSVSRGQIEVSRGASRMKGWPKAGQGPGGGGPWAPLAHQGGRVW